MSKTEMKLGAAVETLVRVVKQAGVMSAAVDIGTFRTMFGLTSMGRKAIARAVDDVLTTNGIVEQFGPWVLAEIEHPTYQLSMLTANRVEFDDGPKDAPVELYVQAGLGPKAFFGNDDDEPEEEKEEPRIAPATEAELRSNFSLEQMKKLRELKLIDQPDGINSPIGELKAALSKKTVKGEGIDFGWDISDADSTLKAEFTVLQLEQLLRMGLIGPSADGGHSFSYLRQQLGFGEKKVKATPKGSKPSKAKPRKASK